MADEIDATNGKRRDPRYVETSESLSDWIKVKVARHFGDPWDLNGVLWDMTVRAVKVAFPLEAVPGDPLIHFHVGTHTLITFTFRDLTTITATATVGRLDKLENGIGVVLFFDLLREADRASIDRICRAYDRNGAPRRDPSLPRCHTFLTTEDTENTENTENFIYFSVVSVSSVVKYS